MSENKPTNDSPAAAEPRNASLEVDPSSLRGEELDFAKEMGFGDEPEEAPEVVPEPASESKPELEPEPETAEAVDPNLDADPDPDPVPESEPEREPETTAESEQDAAEEIAAQQDESETEEKDPAPDVKEGVEQIEPVAASADQDGDKTEWEEIHPRSSEGGSQGILQSRAREVMAYAGQPQAEQAAGHRASAPVALPASPVEDALPEVIAASPASATLTLPEPSSDRSELNALEKEREALSVEFETLNTEHELLLDHQAALQGQLIRSKEEVERLQASLRGARTALTPLPEGERALRAEVLGVRDRLEVAHVENRRLSLQCEADATELSIAHARFEDRQHEVDVRLEEIGRLERELAELSQTAIAHAEKQRELLDLSTRLQAENNELRSAQVALEETLQARNLEISAREEHLAVTREGLLSRDRQMIDLNALLEATRAEVERSETEFARREVEAEQNRRALDRRDLRIASLSETLANIEKVMGRQGNSLSFDDPHSVFESARHSEPDSVAEPDSESEDALASDEGDLRTEAPPAEPDEAYVPTLEQGVRSARALHTPWRNGCLTEWMEPMGTTTLADYFAAHLAQAFDSEWPETLRVWSLGGEQLDTEIRLIEALTNRGVKSIEVEVSDPDAQRAAQRAQRVEGAGWGDQIRVRVGSLVDAESESKADAILLCDALFERGNAALELESCKDGLSEGGLLLFADQIRGGALTLSPDTLTRLEEIWAVLPESLTQLPEFSEIPAQGEDGGVPESEGPAFDTLFGGFTSRSDVGFGHLADLVVGPGRGSALSEDDPATKRLLYSIFGLDESRSITEGLPSRHGVGVFAKSDGGSAASSELFVPEWLVPETARD